METNGEQKHEAEDEDHSVQKLSHRRDSYSISLLGRLPVNVVPVAQACHQIRAKKLLGRALQPAVRELLFRNIVVAERLFASPRKGGNSMSKPSTPERRDDLHRAIQVKGIRIAIFTLGYWGALLFGANQAAELWPQYFARAPFWAAVVAFLGFAWNCYRDLGDWRRLTSLETRAEQELDT